MNDPAPTWGWVVVTEVAEVLVEVVEDVVVGPVEELRELT